MLFAAAISASLLLLAADPVDVEWGSWKLSGTRKQAYEGVMVENRELGKRSGFLASRRRYALGYATLMTTVGAGGLGGRRVAFSAIVRSERVRTWAALWLRADCGLETYVLDNMHDRPIRGTRSGTRITLVVDVPAGATTVAFGALLKGGGRVFLEDPELTIVGDDVPTTREPIRRARCQA